MPMRLERTGFLSTNVAKAAEAIRNLAALAGKPEDAKTVLSLVCGSQVNRPFSEEAKKAAIEYCWANWYCGDDRYIKSDTPIEALLKNY